MLLCGFENFEKMFVRIDMLERLFIMIFNSNKQDESKNREIKLVPDMLNLLGCNKLNFIKVLKKMNYKIYEKDNEVYFRFTPAKENFNKNKTKINFKDSRLLN